MRKIGIFVSLTMIIVFGIFSLAQAEEQKGSGKKPSLTGNIEPGFRLVDVDGSENKFKEHYNLDTGPRLLNFTLDGNYPSSQVLDRFNVQLNNLGGDPYERYGLLVQKDKLYTFEGSFKKSDYYYNTLFYRAGDTSIDNGRDLLEKHAFGTTRENTDLKLTINPQNLFKLTFGYNRIAREGTTDLTVPVGIQITPITTPVDDNDNFYYGSAEFSLAIFDFFLEQDYRTSENKLNFLSQTVGVFDSQERQKLKQPISKAKVHTLLFDRLDLSSTLVYSKSEFDVEVNKPVDDTGVPTLGQGSLDKKIWIWDMEASYSLFESFAIHGIGQISQLKQNGDILFTDNVIDRSESGTVLNRIDSHTVGVELEYVPLKSLSINGGMKRQFRKLEFTRINNDDQEVTLQSGNTIYSFGFFFKPVPSLDLMGRILIGNFDNPYTNISSTDTDNIKFRLRYRPVKNLVLTGTHAGRSTENNQTFFKSTFKSDSLSIGYQPFAKLDVNVGYTIQQGESLTFFNATDAAFVVFGRQGQFAFDSNIISADATYSITKKLRVGMDLRNIDSSGTVPISFSDLGVFLGYLWPYNLETKLKYQWITYDEALLDANDYIANMITFSVALNF